LFVCPPTYSVLGCPPGLFVDNAPGYSNTRGRFVHNCEAPGGQPVFGPSQVQERLDATEEDHRRY
jgi:hypothetical protein